MPRGHGSSVVVQAVAGVRIRGAEGAWELGDGTSTDDTSTYGSEKDR